MKRKFKLFATVASLCLCLALMAFGVYAASSVTYTASGSVNFTVEYVYVEAEVKVYELKNNKDQKVDDISNAEYATTAHDTYAVAKCSTLANDGNYDATDFSGSHNVGELDLNESTAYKIEIVLTNLSTELKIGVATSGIAKQTPTDNFLVASDSSNAGEVAVNGSATLKYYVGIDDMKKVATSCVWSIALTLSQKAAQ